MSIVLDAGALIGVDRRDRYVLALLRAAEQDSRTLLTSAAVAAQVWRGGSRQVNLARVLRGVVIEALSEKTYRGVGELLAVTGTADVADAHVALLVRADDTVLTSDPHDLRVLLLARGTAATIVTV